MSMNTDTNVHTYTPTNILVCASSFEAPERLWILEVAAQ